MLEIRVLLLLFQEKELENEVHRHDGDVRQSHDDHGTQKPTLFISRLIIDRKLKDTPDAALLNIDENAASDNRRQYMSVARVVRGKSRSS